MYRVIIQNYKRTLNETYKRELKDFMVIVDKDGDPMKAFIKCLEFDDNDLLYFEDDAILCHNFTQRLDDIFKELGTDKIILFIIQVHVGKIISDLIHG